MAGIHDELLALVEREHALVLAGAWEELAALDQRRRDLVAQLPATPPADARATVQRAHAIQAQTSALLAAGIDELRRELGTLSHGRAAVRGYGAGAGMPAAAATAPRVDITG